MTAIPHMKRNVSLLALCQGYAQTCVTVVISVSALAALASPTQEEPPRPRNVVFFLADDLGYMDVGANNPETFYETPSLDGLARSGMRFTRAYAACPRVRWSREAPRAPPGSAPRPRDGHR